MKNIDLSIIIISFNTKVLLQNCLTTLFKSLQSGRVLYEVIVIDNASTDGSADLIKKDFPQVKLLQNKQNAGFGKANNQGVEIARGNTILFLNSDIEVLDVAVAKLYDFFLSLPGESIVGGKLFNLDKTPQSSCGPEYSLHNIFIALFLKGDYLHITRYSPLIVKQVDWVMGACIMLQKATFTSLGGFDEGIFMYMEEIDLQYRAAQSGSKIYFYPGAHFTHVGHASSTGRASPILNVFRGFMYFYKKHRSSGEYFILRSLLVLKSISAIILFFLLGKKYDLHIYMKALKLVI